MSGIASYDAAVLHVDLHVSLTLVTVGSDGNNGISGIGIGHTENSGSRRAGHLGSYPLVREDDGIIIGC